MAVSPGVLAQAWVTEESTFDTAVAETAAHAVDFLTFTIEPSLEYIESQQHVGTASHQTDIKGKQGGTWSMQTYFAPNGVNEPDITDLLKVAMGAKAGTAGTDLVYSFIDTAPSSLQLVKKTDSNLYEIVNGAWIETLEIEVPAGGQPPTLTFSGGFASYGWVYAGATVDGAQAGSDTTIELLPATQDGVYRVGVGALVAFGAEDNGGAGYRVTAKSVSGDTITISPGLAGPLSGGEAVTGHVQSQTLAGTIADGVQSGLTIGADTPDLLSGTVTITTGVKALDQVATSDRATEVIRVDRKVEMELEAYFDGTIYGDFIGAGWENVTRNVTVRLGPDTTQLRMKINCPAMRFGVSPIEVPDAEESTFALSGMARQSAAAADECTLTQD